MICLFIDTSLSSVNVSLVKDNKLLSSVNQTVGNNHSVNTTKYLDKVIKDALIDVKDIDKIMIVNGPGSFTGVRIGVAIAKTLAYLINKKVITVSSLKMRSLSFDHEYCMSLIDARRDNYYMGLYDKDNNNVIEEKFVNRDKVMELYNKYNPVIVSDKELDIDNIKVKKVELDVCKIIDYYKDSEEVIAHLVVPNYLKLPQVLEKK